MMFTWKNLRPFIVQAVLLMLIGIIGWLSLGPVRRALIEKRDYIQQMNVLAEYRQRQVNFLPELEEQYDAIVTHADELDIILSKERIVDFVRTLENIAETTGVELVLSSRDNAFLESKTTSSSKPTVDSKEKDSGEDSPAPVKKVQKKETGILVELPSSHHLRLNIKVTGSYLSIVSYLHKIETLPYALDVIGIQLEEAHQKEEQVSGINRMGDPFNPESVEKASDQQTTSPVMVLEATFDTVLYLNQT